MSILSILRAAHTQSYSRSTKYFVLLGEKRGVPPFFNIFGPNFMNFEDFSKYFAILGGKRKKNSLPEVLKNVFQEVYFLVFFFCFFSQRGGGGSGGCVKFFTLFFFGPRLYTKLGLPPDQPPSTENFVYAINDFKPLLYDF